MVFPYLSTTPPENAGIHSGVRQLTGSMGRYTPPWFSPSRPGMSRYGSLIMLWWFIAIREAVPDLQTGCRSALLRASRRSPLMWLLITGLCLKNVYSVVKEHLVRRPRNNLVVTGISLLEKGLLHRDAGRPVLAENRPLYDPSVYFRLFMMSERIVWASVSCF